MGMNESANVAVFSRECSMQCTTTRFCGTPFFFFFFLLCFCKLKGVRGEIGFRYNLVNTQCKEQMGQSCWPPCLLFVCLFVTSCVVLGKILTRLTMFSILWRGERERAKLQLSQVCPVLRFRTLQKCKVQTSVVRSIRHGVNPRRL